jgi:hypothetical protein
MKLFFIFLVIVSACGKDEAPVSPSGYSEPIPTQSPAPNGYSPKPCKPHKKGGCK